MRYAGRAASGIGGCTSRYAPPRAPRGVPCSSGRKERSWSRSARSDSGGAGTPSARATTAGLGDVLVAVGSLERVVAVVRVGGEEAVDLGEVHPPQQVRVERRVRPAVGGDTVDVLVDAADDVDRPLRLGGRTERGRGDEVGGALQPTPRVVPVVAVLGDAGHRQRVQRLQQQRPQTADEHRRVGVDAADRRSRLEPPLAGRIEQLSGAFGSAGADDRATRTWSANQSRIASLGICPSWHGRVGTLRACDGGTSERRARATRRGRRQPRSSRTATVDPGGPRDPPPCPDGCSRAVVVVLGRATCSRSSSSTCGRSSAGSP